MKVDKRNPRHWLYLAAFGLQVVAAWVLGATRKVPGADPMVVLYGHKLSGNLLALHRAMLAPGSGVRPVFLTMDPEYHLRLRMQGVDSCLASSPACLGLLRHASAVVSDHGLHPLAWLVGRSHLRFIDVWHGIPFKGFDAEDFRLQQRYDELWVASPAMVDLYVERFGFERGRLHATGYARTDALVVPREDRTACLARFGLSRWAGRRFVLFAPTWAQDAGDRSLFPFGQMQEAFLAALSQACREAGAVLLVRRHLNSGIDTAPTPDDVVFLPFADHPDTEALLGISDLLVCDWSSIAFDYLLLDRPTIFLDVPPPFRKGFSLGPEYRHGRVVAGMDEMLDALRRYLADPAAYARDVGDRPARIRAHVYGGMADGQAAARGLSRLRELLAG